MYSPPRDKIFTSKGEGVQENVQLCRGGHTEMLHTIPQGVQSAKADEGEGGGVPDVRHYHGGQVHQM